MGTAKKNFLIALSGCVEQLVLQTLVPCRFTYLKPVIGWLMINKQMTRRWNTPDPTAITCKTTGRILEHVWDWCYSELGDSGKHVDLCEPRQRSVSSSIASLAAGRPVNH